MADAVQGKRVIYKYRRLIRQASEAAWSIAFATENGRTLSVDADSTATKDGSVRAPGVPEQEVTSTSIMTKNDPRINEIEDATLDGEKFEIWEINLDEPVSGQTNKYKGKYFQGYCTEFEKTTNAEDMAELSLTFGLEGKGARGNCTVTDAESAQAGYVFTNTTQQTPGVTIPSTASVAVSETVALTAETVPSNATVTWTSSATSTATVDDGVVTGVAAGSAIITAKITVDETDYTDTCTVTVTAATA